MMRGTCCRKSDRTSRPTALCAHWHQGRQFAVQMNLEARGGFGAREQQDRCWWRGTDPSDFSSRSRSRSSAAFCEKVPPRFRYPALHPNPTDRPNLLAVFARFLLLLFFVVVIIGVAVSAVEEERIRRRVDERSGRLTLRSPPRRRRIDDFDASSSSTSPCFRCCSILGARHGAVLVDGVERQPGLSRRVRVLVIPIDGRLFVRGH